VAVMSKERRALSVKRRRRAAYFRLFKCEEREVQEQQLIAKKR
jgi:hypothetical protein